MDGIPQEFQDHELIPTAKFFWRYAPGLDGWGHPLQVHFDRTSNVFRVFDLAGEGLHYVSAYLPCDGDHEIVVPEPWHYARDASTDVIKVNVR